MSDRHKRVTVGEIAGVYGVRGWVRIRSFTAPQENILSYSPWLVGDGESSVEMTASNGRRHGPGLIAQLPGVADRDAAAALTGKTIAVYRSQLPPSGQEIYWTDLEGMEVVTVDGKSLGQVDHLLETGANDVLVVKGDRERLIPFLRNEVVTLIDLEARRLTVDWDAEF